MIEIKDMQERLEDVELKINILDNEIKDFLRKLEEGREVYTYAVNTRNGMVAPINGKKGKCGKIEKGDMVGVRKVNV